MASEPVESPARFSPSGTCASAALSDDAAVVTGLRGGDWRDKRTFIDVSMGDGEWEWAVRLEALGGPLVAALCDGRPGAHATVDSRDVFAQWSTGRVCYARGVAQLDAPLAEVRAGDTLAWALSCGAGTLDYSVNGARVGRLFEGLAGLTLYATFFVGAHTAVRLLYHRRVAASIGTRRECLTRARA